MVNKMKIQTDVIVYIIKIFIINFFVYYSFNKISNVKKININKTIIVLVLNILLTVLCTFIEFYINSLLSTIIMCILYGTILGIISKNKIGYSVVTSMISYAICAIFQVISVLIVFLPYKVINIENEYFNLTSILIIEFLLLYVFFKIKRFKNGFDFLCKRLDNDFADIIILNISITVIITVCLLGTILEEIENIRKNMLTAFIILAVSTILLIQKTLVVYYKQKLQKETLKNYEIELDAKEKEIVKLKNEKYNISKTTHEFYNRQKALELMVKNINIEAGEEIAVLDRIESLTQEYSEKLKKVTKLSEIQLTNIPEIDDMFKYMQSECYKNNIEFKLKIMVDIYYLVNNIIPKSKFETLLGDHIRDAIIAITSSKNKNREILVIIGRKDKNYELCIYDTGIEFEIETLLKLGLEPVTTHKDTGGSGIGFITTFETLKECKASLIIEEKQSMSDSGYTKDIIIRFDGKNEYIIKSYRANKIKDMNIDRKIIIKNLKI